jgi:hypothetical protein
MRPFNSLPLVLFSLIVGCGAPKQTTGQPAKAAPTGPLRVEKPQPDLSPVSAPKDLVLVGRAEHLDNAAATIARWMNLPFDMRMLDTLGAGLSQTLLADAPVEAAVALAEGGDTEVPQPYAVFSVGIASLDAGRTLLDKFGRKLEETTTGVWMTQDESPLTCAVAPAVGRASTRIVCGDRRVDVETLLPYVTRGLPLQAMGTSDVHIEVRLAPIRERYAQQLRQAKALAVPMALHELGISDTRLSRPITDALYALGDEVVDIIDDLDRIVLDSKLAEKTDHMDVSTTLDFTRAHSWSAQVLADAAKRMSAAPSSLNELPSDATLASYVGPQNPKTYEGPMRRLVALIDGTLAHLEISSKLRDELARSLDQFNQARTSTGACGAVPNTGDMMADGKIDALQSFTPWQVCVYDQQPLAASAAVLDATAKITADAAFRKAIGARALSFRRVGTVAGLPTGSVGYELKLDSEALVDDLSRLLSGTSAPKTKAKPGHTGKAALGTVNVYLVPDGTRTLTGMGTDSKAVIAHLNAIKKAPPEHRLAANPGLSWLRSEPAIAGGFFTLSYLMGSVERAMRKHGTKSEAADDLLATAPHHGTTPIQLVWAVHGGANAPKVVSTVRLDRALFEDIMPVVGQVTKRYK